MPLHTLLTVDEAATVLKVHAQTLRRWIRQGKLSANRLGKRLRLEWDELQQLLRPVHTEAEKFAKRERAALASLEDLWDNAEDTIYDDWKRLYGVKSR